MENDTIKFITFSYLCMVKNVLLWGQIFKSEILIDYRFRRVQNMEITF